jgi:hypothetical protein
MTSEQIRIKTDLLMSLVTKVIPDVPKDAFFMDDLSVRVAAMIDPEHFNPKEVKFRDPKKAFEIMMSPV